MKNTGMRWLALNVGDGANWDDWRIVAQKAREIELPVMPWARCRTLQEVNALLALAKSVGFYAILNIENEFKDVLPPSVVAPRVAAYEAEVACAISTVGWVYNDVDYSPLADTPFLLQLFASDMRREPRELEQIQKDCCGHARDKGIAYLGVTFQTYFPAQPEWYSYWDGVRSYFTGDDIGGGSWAKWRV